MNEKTYIMNLLNFLLGKNKIMRKKLNLISTKITDSEITLEFEDKKLMDIDKGFIVPFATSRYYKVLDINKSSEEKQIKVGVYSKDKQKNCIYLSIPEFIRILEANLYVLIH